MRSRFWAFLEACEEAQSPRVVRELLLSTLRALGFDSFLIATHAPEQALSFGVLVHNWSDEAVSHFLASRSDGAINPVFAGVERTPELLDWSTSLKGSLSKADRAWLERLRTLVPGRSVSRKLQSMLLNASATLTSPGAVDPDVLKAGMRVANYAYQHIQSLQRPELNESERLTVREHECLYLAAVNGERPSAVARRLGVKVSTVRTLRQKAYGRLDAGSPEQAVLRMIETGQLFGAGRKSKPRAW